MGRKGGKPRKISNFFGAYHALRQALVLNVVTKKCNLEEQIQSKCNLKASSPNFSFSCKHTHCLLRWGYYHLSRTEWQPFILQQAMVRVKMTMNCNAQTVYRNNPDTNFTVFDNRTLQDSRKYLSRQARDLLVYMLSMPTDWRFNKSHLANEFERNPQTVQKWLSELRKYGHVQYFREHDSEGNFAGGFYAVYEMPNQAANEQIIVRIKKKEKETPAHSDVSPASVYRECIKRLAKRHQLTSSDRDAMALSFTDFMAGLTGKLYSINLYNWLEQALKQRMSTELRTAKISAAKDETAQAHVRREVAKTNYNNNQADQIRSYTPKTTADRMHDDFMDNVNDYVTADTSWADNMELDLDS